MNLLAVFSAYLVAGYAVGSKVSRTVLILTSIFYATVALLTASGQYICHMLAIDVSAEIAARGLEIGSNAYSMGQTLSGSSGEIGRFLSPAIQMLACIGSMVFVFHRTHRGDMQSDT